jgi:Na+-transporting NADH:ubiquinone oxidoreductase subunit E
MQQRAFPNVGVATVYGLGCGIGWLLAIVGMAAITEKIAYSVIPKPLNGLGFAFIITGLMGLGFMCFSGLKI